MFGKLEQKRTEIKRLRDLQRDSIIDEYMAGLYNGLELALSTLEERKAEYFAACMLLNGVERYFTELPEMEFVSKIFHCMSTFQAPYKAVLVSLYEYAIQSENEKLCGRI